MNRTSQLKSFLRRSTFYMQLARTAQPEASSKLALTAGDARSIAAAMRKRWRKEGKRREKMLQSANVVPDQGD